MKAAKRGRGWGVYAGVSHSTGERRDAVSPATLNCNKRHGPGSNDIGKPFQWKKNSQRYANNVTW